MLRIAISLSFVACQPMIGNATDIKKPDVVVTTCVAQCGALGLPLESVVLTYNSVNCACHVEKR